MIYISYHLSIPIYVCIYISSIYHLSSIIYLYPSIIYLSVSLSVCYHVLSHTHTHHWYMAIYHYLSIAIYHLSFIYYSLIMYHHEFMPLIWFQFSSTGFLLPDPEAKKTASNYLVYLFTFLIVGSMWINLRITNLYLSRVGKLTNLGMMFVKFLFGVRVDWQRQTLRIFENSLCSTNICVLYIGGFTLQFWFCLWFFLPSRKVLFLFSQINVFIKCMNYELLLRKYFLQPGSKGIYLCFLPVILILFIAQFHLEACLYMAWSML